MAKKETTFKDFIAFLVAVFSLIAVGLIILFILVSVLAVIGFISWKIITFWAFIFGV